MPQHSDDPQRKAILVIGPHRSGTSAMTRFLNLLGADLPSDLMPAAPSNPTGHWESRSLVAFNDKILARQGLRWDSITPAPLDLQVGHNLLLQCNRLMTTPAVMIAADKGTTTAAAVVMAAPHPVPVLGREGEAGIRGTECENAGLLDLGPGLRFVDVNEVYALATMITDSEAGSGECSGWRSPTAQDGRSA